MAGAAGERLEAFKEGRSTGKGGFWQCLLVCGLGEQVDDILSVRPSERGAKGPVKLGEGGYRS